MLVQTKKYKLDAGTYVWLGLANIVRTQWWVPAIALIVSTGTFFFHTIWFALGASIALLCYFLFWMVQLYGITYLEENKLLFERISYAISSQQIIIEVNTKQGMSISWNQIERAVQGKKYFLLIVSKAHLIYLPHKIFHSNHEIKFVATILQRKGL